MEKFMAKKSTIIITEQQFRDMLIQGILSDPKKFFKDFVKNVFNPSDEKDDKDNKTNTKSDVEYSTHGDFQDLDLNNPEDFKKYEEIANKFISSRSSNLLGITGLMLANAAKTSLNNFKRYVPVELALAQLAQEGGFSKDPNARPIKTKNPFNVGNTGSSTNVFHNSVQSGIQRYYDLIAKNYLTGGKTASDLLNNFVNSGGLRYAGDRNYEASLTKIANQVKTMA
jgi:hypothetical protein